MSREDVEHSTDVILTLGVALVTKQNVELSPSLSSESDKERVDFFHSVPKSVSPWFTQKSTACFCGNVCRLYYFLMSWHFMFLVCFDLFGTGIFLSLFSWVLGRTQKIFLLVCHCSFISSLSFPARINYDDFNHPLHMGLVVFGHHLT